MPAPITMACRTAGMGGAAGAACGSGTARDSLRWPCRSGQTLPRMHRLLNKALLAQRQLHGFQALGQQLGFSCASRASWRASMGASPARR
jgi:hypothetical protein